MSNEDRNIAPQTLEGAFRHITKLHGRVNTLETQLSDLVVLCTHLMELGDICSEVEEEIRITDNNEVVVGGTSWDVPEHQIITSSTPNTPPY